VTKTSNAKLRLIEPTPATEPAHDKAIKLCCAAWRRACSAYMENKRGGGSNKNFASQARPRK
jgi:hypothetical protein